MKKALIFFVVLCFLTVSCASKDKTDLQADAQTPEELYNQALDLLINDREYTQSIKIFDDVDRYYPYSKWALRAQIMMAFAHYVKREYDDALVVLDRFIQLYPGNSLAPYAYYLRALCYYDQISDVKRDQQMTVLALESLQEVINRFPTSAYAKDALIKIDLSNDHLAGKDLQVGRFYLRRNAHLAAMNRFLSIISTYQTTTQVQEALYRLTETYLALGLVEEANKSAAVLGYNYPASPWYEKAYSLMQKHLPKEN